MQIIGRFINNKAYGVKWLISEAIVDTAVFYVYFYLHEVDEVLKV